MGIFITFEGIEGCGKSTQLALLVAHLEGLNIPFVSTREPGGTNIGGRIRSILLGTENTDITDRAELLLYAADRAQHVEEVILPALRSGRTVLCDRYTDATLAYQGFGRGLEKRLISELNAIAAGGVTPDVTFFIDCPVETGLGRARRRGVETGCGEMRFENEELDFHERVMNGYRRIAGENRERVVTLDGTKGIEALQSEIRDALRGRLG